MKKFSFLILACLVTLGSHAAPLPAQEVFQIQANTIDPNTFTLEWHIKPGYFLYSDRITLNPQEDSNYRLAPVRMPPTETKVDKQGKSYTVYRKQLSIPVGILGDKPGEGFLKVHYQGCSDDGFCYPPEDKLVKLTIDPDLALTEVGIEKAEANQVIETSANEDKISKIFIEHNWFMTLLIFYGLGLLLAFTPCILPMVPVLSGIIVGHGKAATTKKAFLLSLSYVLSMSVTYAIVGAIVAKLGANLQASLQTPWAISIFSLVFVLLALSMFGFYEFKLPQSWQSKISGPSQSHRGGHYLGAAIMGCLSTLILSPCVTAPLIGVLSYIAHTGNVALGTLTLFFLGLGMGTPLLLIGTSAGKWLPESGGWMTAVKGFFGVMLLAVAIYLLDRIIPAELTMILWASLLIFSGIYAGALTHASNNQDKFCQGVGIILLGYGLLILIGASSGSTNPLQPLASLQAASAPTTEQLLTVKNTQELDQALAQIKDKPILFDFYADWCASCKVMENTTFKDPRVMKALKYFALIKVDVTHNNQETKALLHRFNVVAPPTYIFFNAQGQELHQLTLVGETSAGEFLEVLRQVI